MLKIYLFSLGTNYLSKVRETLDLATNQKSIVSPLIKHSEDHRGYTSITIGELTEENNAVIGIEEVCFDADIMGDLSKDLFNKITSEKYLKKATKLSDDSNIKINHF